MSFFQNLPVPIQCLLRNEFLYNQEKGHGEYTECHVVAVVSIPSRPLLFKAHLSSGACIDRLPISAFVTKPCGKIPLSTLQLWACLSDDIAVLQVSYFKEYRMKVRLNRLGVRSGTYLFTIDSKGTGFSESPDQHKCFNVGFLNSGQMFAQPNNRCLFVDSYFTSQGSLDYRTNTHQWSVEDAEELGARVQFLY